MLNILTLNLNYYGDKHGPWPARREIIRAAIVSVQADVVALQAVRRDPTVSGGIDQAQQLADLLPGYGHVVFRPAVENADGSAEGSAFVSRRPLGETDTRRLTLLPGLEDTNRRLVMHTRLAGELPPGPLHLFNGHFSWVERQTLRNVDETLTYLAGAGDRALLVGDLNAPATEDRLRGLRAAGWIDVWAHLRPGEPGYTFESSAPSVRIDYAWANPALLPNVKEIELVAAEPGAGGVRASDHLGLVVSLDV